MSFQYALECSIKGKNADIKGAISILPITLIPPLVCPKISTHAGINSSSSYAMGNFVLEFILPDSGEYDAGAAFIKIACDNRNRNEQKFKLTKYTVHERDVIQDIEQF